AVVVVAAVATPALFYILLSLSTKVVYNLSTTCLQSYLNNSILFYDMYNNIKQSRCGHGCDDGDEDEKDDQYDDDAATAAADAV
ncbi:MAG: hypothetical protein ACKO82_10010, partial [Acidimicrobiaceae bacterium]